MPNSVYLNFNNISVEITPDTDGLFDLNDIWELSNLPEHRRPSQWNNRTRTRFEAKNEISMGERTTAGCAVVTYTKSTKRALYAYAAWVCPEFEDAVFEAFEAMASGNTRHASVSGLVDTLRPDSFGPNL